MQTRSRVLVLSFVATVACIAVGAGILSQRNTHSRRVSEAVTSAEAPQPAALGDNDSPFASGGSAGMPAGPASAAPVTSVEVDPSADAPTAKRRARELLGAGQNEAALAWAQRAVELAPKDGSAWNVLGRAQLALGRQAEAESAFTRACDVDPDNAWARNNLGWLHLQHGEWDEAVTWLETAVDRRDDIAAFHNNLGLAYERSGRTPDAQRAFERALELQPGHAMAQVSLARVQAKLQSGLAVAEAPPADTVTSRVVQDGKP